MYKLCNNLLLKNIAPFAIKWSCSNKQMNYAHKRNVIRILLTNIKPIIVAYKNGHENI